MSKFTGNIIRLPAVTPTQNSASGVYTLDDQFTAQSSGTWPIVRDQYFNYTTLLLTGAVQGTAYPNPVTQPYSFLSDASTNNFVVSPYGDVSARPFNPYLNSYSNYFTGSGSTYLSIASSADLQLTNSTVFTIEAFIYWTGTTGTQQGIINKRGSSATQEWGLIINSTGKLVFTNTTTDYTGGTTLNQNRWNHIAVSSDGTNIAVYLNGSRDSTPTAATGIVSSTNDVLIGYQTTTANPYTGYISNLRVVKGTQLYSGTSYPVPTAPLQAVTNTSLLTCLSNRFLDTNTQTTAKTITVSGSPAVSQNSPFVSYDTTNGSGYFDGNDYLLSTATQVIPSGSFTVEAWAYPTVSTDGYIVAQGTSGNSARFAVGIETNAWYTQIGATRVTSTAAPVINAWTHVAVTFNGATLTLYINGQSVGTPASTSTNAQNATVRIGSLGPADWAALYWTGYINSVRVSNTVRAISVPTAPYTTDANTSLLTLQTRAPATNNGFIDSSPNNFVVTRNGNTTQGSFSPFSQTGWGNYFNGSSNLQLAQTSAFQPGTGDFTIEAWVNFSASNSMIIAVYNQGCAFYVKSTGFLAFAQDSVAERLVASTAFPLNQWNHVAVVRSSSNLTIYQNGTAVGSTANSNNLTGIGSTVTVGSGNALTQGATGYISNIRFVNGQALFTGAFTPSVAPINSTTVGSTGSGVPTQTITGTVALLTCQSNRFKDNSPNNYTITLGGSPSVQAFSPFAPAQSYIPSQIGGSGYFDGTTDYLTTPASSIFDFAAGQAFTVDFWFYQTTSATVAITQGGGNTFSIDVTMGSSGSINYGKAGVANIISASASIPISSWNHLVISRNTGNQSRMWLNGVSIGSSSSDSYSFNNAVQYIGSNANPGNYVTGYLSGFRVLKGTALYDPTSSSNITVPTAPPTAIPNTSLLLNFTNGGIVDATGKNNLETVGNSGVQTTVIKYGNGSMYFDGTSDYLLRPYSDLLNINSGDFTIEAWVYPTVNKTFSTVAAMWGTAQQSWIFDINNGVAGFAWQANSISVNFLEAGSVSLNVWSHLAVTRQANTFRLFVNGNSTASLPSSNNSLTTSFSVGAYDNGASGNFAGYISNLRITKGVARYTSNFNTNLPPGPFPLG